jgi:hypothetical protein
MIGPHRPARMTISSMLIIQSKPFKKSSTGQSGELCPHWTNFTSSGSKINVDPKTLFGY